MLKRVVGIACLGWVGQSLAINTLGQAADGLFGPVSVVTMLMELACYIIGTSFCIGAIMQYRIHRQNPKLTPLMTPVIMLVVGVLLILMPYFSVLPGDSFSASEQEKRDSAAAAQVIREYNAQQEPVAQPDNQNTQAAPKNPNDYWQ
jgi:hypothetical protein